MRVRLFFVATGTLHLALRHGCREKARGRARGTQCLCEARRYPALRHGRHALRHGRRSRDSGQRQVRGGRIVIREEKEKKWKIKTNLEKKLKL